MTRSKRFYAAIIALLMAVVLMVGAVMGIGALSASAAEAEPATPGWYVMGNGAGTTAGVGLKDCSWTEYKADYKLKASVSERAVGENYLGSWETAKLALYVNDQFKFLYADGTLAGPDDASWGAGFVGDFYSISEEMRTNFWDGGLGNIQIKEGYEGWYTFFVDVYQVEGAVQIDVSYDYDDTTPLPKIEKEYQMYVVGHIASISGLGWPGETETETGEPLTYTLAPMEAYYVTEDGETVIKYYSKAIEFHTTDKIKVFNDVDDAYYPSGVANDVSPEDDGTFYVEWEQDAPSFIFADEIPADAVPVPTPAN